MGDIPGEVGGAAAEFTVRAAVDDPPDGPVPPMADPCKVPTMAVSHR